MSEIGINTTSQCYDCNAGNNLVGLIETQEIMCANCMLDQEARSSDRAYEIVDEGNMIYPHAWLINRAEPSNHDWTERDGEYKEPIVKLQDGGEYEELWELQDETQRARETECPWCHLLTPKQFNDCQDCDKPLESNVR